MKNGIKIEKLNIASFGGLTEKEVALDGGINLINAPNEGGKTTLAAFIRFGLYGFQGRSQSISDNPKKMYTPWSGAAAAGSITVNGDRRLRIERSVVGTKESAACIDTATGTLLYGGGAIGEEILGVSGEMFEKTAFLSSVMPPQSKDEALADRLQNLVFSADEQISGEKAEKLLTKHKNALKGRGGSGRIYELEAKALRLEEQLRTELDTAKKLERLEGEALRAEQGLAASKEEERAAEEALRGYEKYEAFKLLKERERLVTEAEVTAVAARADSPSLEAIERIRSLKSDYDRKNDRCDDAKADYNHAVEASTVTDSELRKKANEARAMLDSAAKKARTLLIIGLITAVLVVGIGLIIASFTVKNSAAKKLKEYGFSDAAELAAVEARLAAEEEAAGLAAKEARQAFNRLSLARAEQEASAAALKAALEAEGAVWEGDDCDRLINDLLRQHIDGQTLKTKAKSAAIALEVFDGNHSVKELETLAEGAVEPKADKKQLDLEKRTATLRVSGYREALGRLGEAIAALKARHGDPLALAEELSYTEKELTEAKDSYDALCLAIEELENASNLIKQSISPRLAARAAELFSELTDGKYRTVELDTKLAMTVDSPYGQKSAEHLSRGARDGVYLCLRLALIELLYEGKSVPLVLDDAFVHIDTPHLERMLGLLAKSGHQLIITSCTDREKNALDRLGLSYRYIEL